jgi:hypothetical protein
MTVAVDGESLMSQVQGQPALRLVPSAENVFRVAEVNATLTFNERGGLVESISLVQGATNLTLGRITPEAAARRGIGRGDSASRAGDSDGAGDWTSQLARVSW